MGETLEQRESDQTFDVIRTQLQDGLANLSNSVVANSKELIIAYEPVWAIGTGILPSVNDVENINKNIHEILIEKYNTNTKFKILYGGSVKSVNAYQYLRSELIDGVLIGGASLITEEIDNIINFK